MKKCPFCAEEIQQEAIKCRYCGEWLDLRPKKVDLSPKAKKKPVRGWLALYIILSVTLSPISFLASAKSFQDGPTFEFFRQYNARSAEPIFWSGMKEPENARQATIDKVVAEWAEGQGYITTEEKNRRISALDAFLQADKEERKQYAQIREAFKWYEIGCVLMSIFSIVQGVMLWRATRRGLLITRAYLVANIVFIAGLLLISYFLDFISPIHWRFLFGFIGPIVWLAYFGFSKRVRDTFGKAPVEQLSEA